MTGRIVINANIALDPGEIQEEFFQADGPGGQNVNKVSSAVRLRFDVVGCASLPEDIKTRLLHLAGRRRTSQGELVIEARQFRTREQNRRAALERLIRLIQSADQKPKARHPTRPTTASRQRRMAQKKKHGEIKRLRRSIPEE
jgi:ribosome-associated protein